MNIQLSSIKKSLQPHIIGSFWTMLRELEGKADNDNDPVLKHFVQGWYRQWNEMTGDDKVPVWVTRECKAIIKEQQAYIEKLSLSDKNLES